MGLGLCLTAKPLPTALFRHRTSPAWSRKTAWRDLCCGRPLQRACPATSCITRPRALASNTSFNSEHTPPLSTARCPAHKESQRPVWPRSSAAGGLPSAGSSRNGCVRLLEREARPRHVRGFARPDPGPREHGRPEHAGKAKLRTRFSIFFVVAKRNPSPTEQA